MVRRDLLQPVRFVATQVETSPMTTAALAVRYATLTGPDSHQQCVATVRNALRALGDQVRQDRDGWRLTVPFSAVRYDGHQINRYAARTGTDPWTGADPFSPGFWEPG